MFYDFTKGFDLNTNNTYVLIGNLQNIKTIENNGDTYHLINIVYTRPLCDYVKNINCLVPENIFINMNKNINSGIYCHIKYIPEFEQNYIRERIGSLIFFKIVNILEQSENLKIPYLFCPCCGKIFGFNPGDIPYGNGDYECDNCDSGIPINRFILPNPENYDNSIYEFADNGLPKVKYDASMRWRENSAQPFYFVPYFSRSNPNKEKSNE